MAIKDWKQIGEHKWLRKNRNLPVIIYVQKDKKQEKVLLNYSSLGSFKTKSQALAFAKQYMKTH